MHPLLTLDRRPVVGHRGNSAHAPENTLESFDQAVALGVDALEFDVRLTADGHVVVHHDPTVERTTGGVGAIASLTLGAVRALDAGARFTPDGGASFPYRERDVRVPTLDELLGRHPDTPLLIEIKTPAASEPTRRLVERHGAEDRVVVDAFDAACLTPFAGSRIAVGSSRNDVARLMACALSGFPVRAVPYRVVCVPTSYSGLRLPIGRFTRILERLGVPVHIWTVNDPVEARRLWSLGVRGIISDDPGTMLRLRAATGASGPTS
ncbi:glycerophosphoryl diester phosphodiesterase [Gemmatirosa kalamazoonensis]|uniref:Glycerophosphoryl diester phosphodiesterase n=1 Tax=Gemmatirosa kalamazoonensis TaxID=861299 RepID=W0RJV6_9BACT|nr:glycerophosphodiester phosphodiesterase [Gemmatirosa kalamazoonensis]AHG91066.1 glycerophosphoryl diester phosphodiesterase [Gemmatirosa kalamazoonensis]